MKNPFVIRDTGTYGKGVFATRPIGRGEVIHRFDGETLTARDIIVRLNAGAENIDDPLQVGKRTYIDLDGLSRTFNHSCDPNAALRKRSELFCIRDIAPGEEITYDYSLTIAPTQWSMRCRCGAASCRKMLGDVLSIPAARRDEYRALGAIQDYMRRLLDQVDREGGYRMPAYEARYLEALARPSVHREHGRRP